MENSRGRKARKALSKYCPDLRGLQSPYSNRDSTLSTWGKNRIGVGMGGSWSWDPSSTTILPRSSLVTSFLPLPIVHPASSTCPHPVPGAQAQMPAPRHKRSVFTFKAGCCPLRTCPRKGSTRDCTPAQSPRGTDASLWLETFLNMSLAQGVGFPGRLGPGILSQDFRICREGEGWAQAGSGGSQLRQPAAGNIA